MSGFVGKTLDGRYQVERPLGEGGMASVYLATDTRMNRTVVIKVPHPELLRAKGYRERFEREVHSLTALEHPHVVPVLDAGVEDDTPYVVLRHLAGGSLYERLQEAGGRLSPVEIADWLPPVAGALDTIHARGWIHRDLKPGNILFDGTGNVSIADFGIAKALEGSPADEALTSTGVCPGSPPYIAPEMIDDISVPASDQYALGVVVYQCLAGVLPFDGRTPMSMMVKKATHPPRPIERFAPGVSAAVRSVVLKALAGKPADRFVNCSAFASAFRAATEGAHEIPTVALPPPPPTPIAPIGPPIEGYPTPVTRPAPIAAPIVPPAPTRRRRRSWGPLLFYGLLVLLAFLLLVGIPLFLWP